MNIGATIRQNPIASFIVLTLGLSFATMLLPISRESAFSTIAFIAVTFPTIVAVALVTLMEGRRGAGTFLRQALRWRIPVKWYLVVLVIGFTVHFGSSVLALVTGRIASIEFPAPTAFFIAFFPLALLEEIGWRGFALRRLLDRRSPLVASLIVGIPWALMHFVLYVLFIPEGSPLAEGLVVLAFAFLLTWIFVRSGRNVLVAAVLHGALNAFGFVSANIPPTEALWFVLASACLAVVALVVIDWRVWFGHPTATSVGEVAPSVA